VVSEGEEKPALALEVQAEVAKPSREVTSYDRL
jgi:hypothetical protein